MKKISITSNLLLLIFVSLIIPTLCINGSNRPFTLGVRDSLMIAHSFHNHPSFGIAGGMVSKQFLLWIISCMSGLINWLGGKKNLSPIL